MNASTTATKKTTNGITHAAATTGTLAQLANELRASFPERGDVVTALLAAAVAGEHTVMLGPPGTAKSLLARSLSAAFGASYFETLMTRFTTPEEIFGPVKLSGLQQDRFTRATTGYFPTSEVAFLDEIFKANSAILNALLTALNERVFHDDGKPNAIPLLSCVAASNELPEGPELDALYDRFLVRVVTDYIADRDAFRAMLTAPPIVISSRVDIRAAQKAARAVVVTEPTLEALVTLRDACRKDGHAVSDRRWRQCLSLIRAAAHLDGRTETDPEDLEILEHVLWRKPDERVTIARVIQKTVNPAGAQAVSDLDAAREIFARAQKLDATDLAAIAPLNADLSEIAKRLARLPSGRKVDAARAEVSKIKSTVARLALRGAGVDF